MKLNQDKCYFLLSDHKPEVIFAKVGHLKIWESCTQKLLRIIIDQKFKFDEYILIQCKKLEGNLKHQQEFARIWVWSIEEVS